LHFVALFLGRVGRFDPSDRSLVYFSVLHDPFGQFKGAVIVGKDGVEKQTLRDAVARPSKRLSSWALLDLFRQNRTLKPEPARQGTEPKKQQQEVAYER
jgi:hypothetical protein